MFLRSYCPHPNLLHLFSISVLFYVFSALRQRLHWALVLFCLLASVAQGGPLQLPADALREDALRDGQAEQRLMQVLTLTSMGQTAQALQLAQELVREYPNFQLAQLALGDLLLARTHGLATFGNIDAPNEQTQATLHALRVESLRRIAAQNQALAPPLGSIPTQFVQLPRSFRHAIAIDAALSRLYLLENGPQGLHVIANYYASVGKLGIDKTLEGDQRTPLGVYFITSSLDPKTLDKFYGSGALPLNYPNPLDVRRGKTGHGIWLHGTPPQQFSRAPQATDGCVALANPDLERVLRTVQPRTTAVVIAPTLTWVQPQELAPTRQAFAAVLAAWRQARSDGMLATVLDFYTEDFQGPRKMNLAAWRNQLQGELTKQQGRQLQLKDLSLLHWQDVEDTMIVTFGAVPQGKRTGAVKRQYWRYEESLGWKIFYEATIG